MKGPKSQPLYVRLSDHIRENIESGIYQVGQQIPTENELIDRFNVSRITVRKAIQSLVDQRLLKKC
ncbi:MAG: GntR family transcriptional regulator, partial [Eubacteriales bacterium]|nr:GntR family transcriptional regulator [Eubacteriales bacterium]